MYLDKKSETLKIIQYLRDEAHRFGITFHRNKRDKATIVTELDRIEGIGKISADKLLKEFKSVKNIQNAIESDLRKVLNEKQVQALVAYFKNKKTAL